jgi:hypothetical protein
MSEDIMWIITAPSCAGKSTFIESKTAFEMTNLSPTHFLQADRYVRGKRLEGTHYLHFCMRFKPTPIYEEWKNCDLEKQAVVLAVPKLQLMRRIKIRARDFEEGNAPAPPRGYLNTIKKLSTSEYLNLYEVAFKQFRKLAITYTILRADKLNYPEISEEKLPQLLREGL